MNAARLVAAVALAAGVLGPVAGGAAELEYGLALGLGTTDNIGRVPSPEQSETIAATRLDLSLDRQGTLLETEIEADLRFHQYQDDFYENELSGTAYVEFLAKLVPDHVEWVLTDSFGQASLEPFDAPTPDNLETVNYLTTGPNFTARFGTATSLMAFGRYSATNYEDSNFDDQRTMAGLSLARELATSRSLSLNAVSERVEFDDPAFGSDYDRLSGFLRYEFIGGRTGLILDAGYTELHDFEDTRTSPLLQLDVTRRLSERTTLALRGGVRSSDTGSALNYRDITGGLEPDRPEVLSSADPFEERHGMLTWQLVAPRTEFEISGYWADQVYERDSFLDRELGSFHLVAERRITSRISASASASWYTYDYDASGQQDDESQFSLNLSWNLTGRLYVQLELERYERESTNVLSDFDENTVFLMFAWRDRVGTSEAE